MRGKKEIVQDTNGYDIYRIIDIEYIYIKLQAT